MIILDFLTDRGENAACQDQEVSEWGGDNTLIATPGARSKAAVITSQNTNPCLLHYLWIISCYEYNSVINLRSTFHCMWRTGCPKMMYYLCKSFFGFGRARRIKGRCRQQPSASTSIAWYWKVLWYRVQIIMSQTILNKRLDCTLI